MANQYGPSTGSFLQTGRADTARFVEAGVSNLATFAIKEYLRLAQIQANVETQKGIATIASVYSAAVQQQWRKNVDKINTRVAQDAQKAMLRRYEATLDSGQDTQAYRANAPGNMRRYAGGILRNALASPNMFKATKDGIVFGNPEWLDSKARQWARLNFGAGPRAGSGSRDLYQAGKVVDTMTWSRVQSPTVRFFGAEMNIDLGSPRPTWVIPTGIWANTDLYGKSLSEAKNSEIGSIFTPLAGMNTSLGGGVSGPSRIDGVLRSRRSRLEFQGRSLSARKVSQGVAARGFLEAGAGSIARNLPVAGVSYLLSIFEQSTDQAVNTIPNKKALDAQQINSAVTLLSNELEAALARMSAGPQNTARALSKYVRGL